MWGFSKRAARLGDQRRPGREFQVGLVRGVVRGPVEHAVVELVGELDFTNAQAVSEVVLDMQHNIVAVDISHLEFVDGEGVRQLTSLVERLGARMGTSPQLTGTTPPVARAFHLVAQGRERQLAVH